MSKASENDLNEIHALVAKLIKSSLTKEEVSEKDLAVAIKFLKDNSIQADPEYNKGLSALNEAVKKVDAKTLPFPKITTAN